MHCRRCNGAFEDINIAKRSFNWWSIVASVYIMSDRPPLLWMTAFCLDKSSPTMSALTFKPELWTSRHYTFPSLFHSIFHWDASSISIWSCGRRLHLTDELTLLSLPLDDLENHEHTPFSQFIAFSCKKKRQKGDLHQTLTSGNLFRLFRYPWHCSCLDWD